MSSDTTIDYDAMTQDAMRGVVKRVLEETAGRGLPGDHHFYVSFDTLAPGVVLSKRLRDKYAEEMTIVLQHRFWDLSVSEDRFEVKLTFDGIPERLVIPFNSIKVFFDPSVRYGVQFEAAEFVQEDRSHPVIIDRGDHQIGDRLSAHEREPDHPTPDRLDPQPGIAANVADPDTVQPSPKIVAAADAQTAASGESEASSDGDENENESGGAEIVSLDAFRKK